jgi:hypothetical protein
VPTWNIPIFHTFYRFQCWCCYLHGYQNKYTQAKFHRAALCNKRTAGKSGRSHVKLILIRERKRLTEGSKGNIPCARATSYAKFARNICVTCMYAPARIRRKCCMHLPHEERATRGVAFWPLCIYYIWYISSSFSRVFFQSHLLRWQERALWISLIQIVQRQSIYVWIAQSQEQQRIPTKTWTTIENAWKSMTS